MIQTTRATSPLKGVNRAFAREAQPDGTCWDAVNVLPQDRYGRLRIGQRSGLGQLAELDGTHPVRLLHVASSARTITSGGNTVLLSEPFNKHDDSFVSALGGGTRWVTAADQPDAYLFTAVDTTALVMPSTSTHLLMQPNPASSGRQGAILKQNIGLGANYQVDFKFNVSSADLGLELGMVFRLDSVPMNGVTLEMFSDVSPGDGSMESASLPFANFFSSGAVGIAVDTDHTCTVIVTGNNFEVKLDGTSVFTWTNSDYSTNTGMAVYMGADNPDNIESGIWDFVVSQPGGGAPSNIDRTVLNLIGVTGTKTYIGDPTAMTEVSNDASFPVDADAVFVSAATLFGYTYIVDGTQKPLRLDLATQQFVTFSESAETAPDDCNIACAWRGRLVLAGSSGDPQNFFASRAGDPLDWDYSQEDPAAAFIGNAAPSGRIGQPIHALIPISADILVIGCEQSMWAVRGDIADGGSIDQITDFAGISSSTAWTRGPDGSIYFVGPRGFFKMNPLATEVQEISQMAYPQFFQNIDRSTTYINLVYDADRYGIWAYLTPTTEGASIQSIFYDFRFQGFWPQDWRNQLNAGPVSAIYWDGYNSGTRYPVLGGYDGFLYAFNLTNRTDNGGTIVGSVTLGPFHPAEGESMLVGLTANFGELSPTDQSTPTRWETSVSLFSGKSAYDITEGAPTSTGLVDWGRDGRTKTMRQRLRGEWFAVMLSNAASGNYFSMESVELEFDKAGKNRRQR